jgi:uncharacterized protein YxjI
MRETSRLPRIHRRSRAAVAAQVTGNIVDHEYKIERNGDAIAVVSKKWLRARDTYGVEVRDVESTVLVLTVTVAVDALAHD